MLGTEPQNMKECKHLRHQHEHIMSLEAAHVRIPGHYGPDVLVENPFASDAPWRAVPHTLEVQNISVTQLNNISASTAAPFGC